MKNQDWMNFLNDYADALNAGPEAAQRLLQQHPAEAAELASLLHLAWQLKQLLVPLAAPAGFKTELRRGLLQTEFRAGDASARAYPRTVWMSAAAIGSLLPLLGLLVFWRRRQRAQALPTPSPAV